jgi:predicted ABC-type transport system involved in lysophospholipase L1 biosynthesis ATPase subunit
MDQVASQSHDTAVLVADKVVKEVSSPEGSLTILSDISFSIAAGESVAIQGASGAGKSTLLALLAGLDIPTSGSICLNGSRLTELDEDGRAAVRALARTDSLFQASPDGLSRARRGARSVSGGSRRGSAPCTRP